MSLVLPKPEELEEVAPDLLGMLMEAVQRTYNVSMKGTPRLYQVMQAMINAADPDDFDKLVEGFFAAGVVAGMAVVELRKSSSEPRSREKEKVQ